MAGGGYGGSPINISDLRWGRNITLAWTDAAIVGAPGAGAALVSKTVTAGKHGYIYGFMFNSSEANTFILNWTSGGVAKARRFLFGGGGFAEDVATIAFNEGFSADPGTVVTVTVLGAAAPGSVYQANILYGEL